jgi:hypothetical protein
MEEKYEEEWNVRIINNKIIIVAIKNNEMSRDEIKDETNNWRDGDGMDGSAR